MARITQPPTNWQRNTPGKRSRPSSAPDGHRARNRTSRASKPWVKADPDHSGRRGALGGRQQAARDFGALPGPGSRVIPVSGLTRRLSDGDGETSLCGHRKVAPRPVDGRRGDQLCPRSGSGEAGTAERRKAVREAVRVVGWPCGRLARLAAGVAGGGWVRIEPENRALPLGNLANNSSATLATCGNAVWACTGLSGFGAGGVGWRLLQ